MTLPPPLRTSAVALVAVVALASFAARAGEAKPDGPALLMQLISRSDDAELHLDILRGVHAALEGRRNVPAPRGWSEAYAKVGRSQQAELRSLARALAAIYGDAAAIADMRKTLADPSVDAGERRAVLQSLLTVGEPTLAESLHRLVNDPALRDAALAGLAAYDDPDTPKVILGAYPQLDINARRIALNTLAGRIEYARVLAAAVRDGRVPKSDLTAATVRQLRDLGATDLTKFVDEAYGVARESSAEKAAEIAKYKSQLTDDRIAKADASRGRAVFTRVCAQCHTMYGAGGTVGPDLTGSQRANLDYFLTNVVDPSALIAAEYQVTLIRTKDKRVISGIASEAGPVYKVVTEAGAVTVQKTEVDKLRKSDLSMMPEGLMNGLTESEVADLAAYLRTTAQVPLPNGQ